MTNKPISRDKLVNFLLQCRVIKKKESKATMLIRLTHPSESSRI